MKTKSKKVLSLGHKTLRQWVEWLKIFTSNLLLLHLYDKRSFAPPARWVIYTTSRTLIYKLVIGMKNVKRCNQCLLKRATIKIWHQKWLVVTIEQFFLAWVRLKTHNESPSSNKVFSSVAPWMMHTMLFTGFSTNHSIHFR